MTQASRKRSRIEDEGGEFMPLSKRINNLHINGFTQQLHHQHLQQQQQQYHQGRQQQQQHSNEPKASDGAWTNQSIHQDFVPSPNASDLSQGSPAHSGYESYSSNQSNSSCGHDYMPDMDANENPFYYENNKLLYSLYVERMQRVNDVF